MGIEIQAFDEIEWDNFTMNLVNQIRNCIESQKKDYILTIDETEYKNYLFSEFELVELEILKETEEVIPSTSKQIEHSRSGRPFERDIYIFVIRFSFQGSPILFKLHPNNFTVTSNKIYVDAKTMKVSYSFKLDKRDVAEFEREKRDGYHHSFINVSNINSEVVKWNAQLPNIISNNFDHIKQKYLAEHDFFKEINAKVDPNTSTIYTVPTIKKKIIPKPEASSKEKYHNFPSMSMEMYLV